MQGVGGHARVFEFLCEVEGEHHEGQFALGVRPHAIVAPLEHDVVEGDRTLPRRGDVDDTRRHRPL
jgi:hypothetical protein